jgi:hypothetical protein
MDGKRSTLIVASYDYQDPGLRLLRAPARDAEALARVLQDPEIGDFEVRTITTRVEPFYGPFMARQVIFIAWQSRAVWRPLRTPAFCSTSRLSVPGLAAFEASALWRRVLRGWRLGSSVSGGWAWVRRWASRIVPARSSH